MASNIENAQIAFDKFEDKWSSKYDYAVKLWRKNFNELVNFFDCLNEIRKIIYTTNGIENLNQKIRKVPKKQNLPNINYYLKWFIYQFKISTKNEYIQLETEDKFLIN